LGKAKEKRRPEHFELIRLQVHADSLNFPNMLHIHPRYRDSFQQQHRVCRHLKPMGINSRGYHWTDGF